METLLFAGLGLIMLGLLLMVIEAFVPSGGVIAIVAAICAVAGVVILFRYDTIWGVTGLLGVLILGPVAFFSALSVLPNTKLGQQMMGPGVEDIAAERARDEKAHRAQREALIDQEGIARSALRPVGIVEIDGKRHDAVALGGIIDHGARVRVVKVDGLQISVRSIDS